MVDDPEQQPDVVALNSFIDEVVCVPLKPFRPDTIAGRLALASPKPRFIRNTYSTLFAGRIRQVLARKKFDLVVASQVDTAMYRDEFRDLPSIFDEVEVAIAFETYSRAPSSIRKMREGLTWFKHRRYIASLLGRYQACTVVSEQEKALLCEAVRHRGRIEIVPNAIDVASYQVEANEYPLPNRWIFAGSLSYKPNYEAAGWFSQRVLPRILAAVPNFHLMITGRPGRDLGPKHSSITMTGLVDDVRPLIAGSWGSLVPMLTGGGTRLKILESMALQTPVVSTSKGAEGLDVVSGRHLLLADTPERFAEEVIRLSMDAKLRSDLGRSGRDLVESQYDVAEASQKLLELIDQVIAAY